MVPGARLHSAVRRCVQASLAVGTIAALTLGIDVASAGSPVTSTGAAVQAVVTGAPTPTAFAFHGPTMFVGEGPAQPSGDPGGLFVRTGDTVSKVAGSPSFVYGLAWHDHALYVSTGPSILAMGGWNGTSFATTRTVSSPPSPFPGFNGIAFSPGGRLYAGLSLVEPTYDHAKEPFPLEEAVVSMTASGDDLRVVARGLRQPWQLHFVAGEPYPYVSDEAQDHTKVVPPDEIVIAKPGEDYGFPTCTWERVTVCGSFTKPLIVLPGHASPMGISSIGNTLYVALYSGLGFGPEVVTIPAGGGDPTPLITGFASPVIALGIHDGNLFVGEQSGTIWKLKLKLKRRSA